MAQKVTVVFTDDLDPTITENVETVPFSLDGGHFEIDLGVDNASRLRSALSTYKEAARKLSGLGAAKRGPGRPKATASTAEKTSAGSAFSPAQRKEIREYAVAHGAPLGERGRLPQWAVDAYQAQDPSLLKQSAVAELQPV